MRVSTLVLLLLVAPAAVAQPAADVPTPVPEDVTSVDAILAALYEVISGSAGEERDWDRMRSLFYPGARLIPTGLRPDGHPGAQVWTVDEYIDRAGPLLMRDGFWETEIGRTTERFGAVTHAFSAYESRIESPDAEPYARGINSIQLFDDGRRWWVISVFWASEREDLPIPERYLSKEH